MRKLTALTAVCSAITTAYLLAKQRKSAHNTEWIDGGEPELSAADFGPRFGIGEPVVVVNPFTHDFAHVDIDGETPLYYQIKAILYDEPEATFRYMLEGESEWFAESWLDIAPHPVMAVEYSGNSDVLLAEITSEEMATGPAESKLTDIERKLLAKAMDDSAREFTIDMCLEKLSHGTAQEKAEAERVLTELTAKEDSE